MAAMEVEVPVQSGSIFMCSEENCVCHHACCGRDHKILWHNNAFLGNESDVEEDDKVSSHRDIVETTDNSDNRRGLSSTLGSLTEELLMATQADFEEALTHALIENGLAFDDGDDSMDEDSNDEEGDIEEDFEFEVMERILAHCYAESRSDSDDEEMFTAPPRVQRLPLSNISAYDGDAEEDREHS